jgi:hypothetical protein
MAPFFKQWYFLGIFVQHKWQLIVYFFLDAKLTMNINPSKTPINIPTDIFLISFPIIKPTAIAMIKAISPFRLFDIGI